MHFFNSYVHLTAPQGLQSGPAPPDWMTLRAYLNPIQPVYNTRNT